jgi:ubiquinone/menaquinone biosynthesis C-methylase UbiE
MTDPELHPRICDYEGSNYRTEFWEGGGRDYEDRAERIALRRLLPVSGRRLLEVGAGYGRLTSEYDMFAQVVLLDYSLSQLQYAQEHLGRSPRFIFVAADAYKLPFQSGTFDAVTMIRVIHHMAKVDDVLAQLRRALISNGMLILEHANKRNLKAMVRYGLHQQTWSPYDQTPVEFVELNFDFHPQYIKRELEKAGFKVKRRMPVSFFRLQTLKERVSTDVLVSIDGLLQSTGLLVAPSVFIKAVAAGATPNHLDSNVLFACPECGGSLARKGDTMICEREGRSWAVRDGIYDFKAPIEEG